MIKKTMCVMFDIEVMADIFHFVRKYPLLVLGVERGWDNCHTFGTVLHICIYHLMKDKDCC